MPPEVLRKNFHDVSNEFAKGIVAAEGAAACPCLIAALEIDSRGGFIPQSEFETALDALSFDKNFKKMMEAEAKGQGISVAELCVLGAFKIRVMLNHVRIKRRSWLKLDEAIKALTDEHLTMMYVAIEKKSTDLPPAKKKEKSFFEFPK